MLGGKPATGSDMSTYILACVVVVLLAALVLCWMRPRNVTPPNVIRVPIELDGADAVSAQLDGLTAKAAELAEMLARAKRDAGMIALPLYAETPMRLEVKAGNQEPPPLEEETFRMCR